MLRLENPALFGTGGIHVGMCRHGLTPLARRKSAGTQVNWAPAVVTDLIPASISAMPMTCPHALYVPNTRCSARRIIHSARSRASMI